MQVCDFCGLTESRNRAGETATVRRFRLGLKDINPTAAPDWSQKRYWWLIDLCATCLKQFVQTQDNLVLPETDEVPIIKKGSNFAFKRIEDETKGKTPEN